MKILFVGDVFGEQGRKYLFEKLPEIKEQYKPNLIIVNGENAAHGRGITKDIYKKLMNAGVNMITMGNHTFDNHDIFTFIDDENTNIVRPANYYEAPGVGYKYINYNNKKILVINILGRSFMNMSLENPFVVTEKILNENKADYTIIDFHAEATAEKMTYALHFDGKVSAIVGTHTHIPTADNRKLPKGTLYITDIGMTGPLNGSIGLDIENICERFIKGYTTLKNKIAEGPRWLNAAILDFDNQTIERINLREE